MVEQFRSRERSIFDVFVWAVPCAPLCVFILSPSPDGHLAVCSSVGRLAATTEEMEQMHTPWQKRSTFISH